MLTFFEIQELLEKSCCSLFEGKKVTFALFSHSELTSPKFQSALKMCNSQISCPTYISLHLPHHLTRRKPHSYPLLLFQRVFYSNHQAITMITKPQLTNHTYISNKKTKTKQTFTDHDINYKSTKATHTKWISKRRHS